MIREHVLSLLLTDRYGALDRLLGVLRRRRYTVRRLLAEKTEQAGVMYVDLAVAHAEDTADRLQLHMEKLVDVRRVQLMSF